jgi:hypothetical protein
MSNPDPSLIPNPSTLIINSTIVYGLFTIYGIEIDMMDGAKYDVYARAANVTPDIIRFYLNTDPIFINKKTKEIVYPPF